MRNKYRGEARDILYVGNAKPLTECGQPAQ